MKSFFGIIVLEIFFPFCSAALGRYQDSGTQNFSLSEQKIKPQTSNSFLTKTQIDTINSKDTLIILPAPNLYTNSHLLFGAEIIDPLRPKDIFTERKGYCLNTLCFTLTK